MRELSKVETELVSGGTNSGLIGAGVAQTMTGLAVFTGCFKQYKDLDDSEANKRRLFCTKVGIVGGAMMFFGGIAEIIVGAVDK